MKILQMSSNSWMGKKKCGIAIQWIFFFKQRTWDTDTWYNGWILKTVLQLKEASHRSPLGVWFICINSPEYANDYVELAEERTSGKGWGMTSNGYRKGKNVLKLNFSDICTKYTVNILKSTEFYAFFLWCAWIKPSAFCMLCRTIQHKWVNYEICELYFYRLVKIMCSIVKQDC